MANTTIPNLPSAVALNGTEQLPAVQAGTSVRVMISQIALYTQSILPIPGVTTFSAGTTGLGPSSPSNGNVVLGGVLLPASGGTGVNNGTSTLTLGGSLRTSGAYSTTFTMTGPTSITLPTSGTLATTSNTVASFSGGSTGLTPNTATTGAVTLGGTLAPAAGGLGSAAVPTSGQIPIGNGTTYTASTLTAGAGINIVNGA